MHTNMAQSENNFAVTSAKRVVVFQASLQLVREDVLSNKGTKHSTSKWSNQYM